MAEMIPETLNCSDSATDGEKRVFRLLRDSLLPDEDFLVWFEPKAIKRRPDFLVWSHELGLLVIEVKDWEISQIRSMTPNQWQIERRGAIELCDSPIEQARKCFIQFKQLFEQHNSLCHNDPTKRGRLRFPIGYSAIFTKITRAEAEQEGILSVLKPTFCFFADDLVFDVTEHNARRAFCSKLKSGFTHWFSFEPISREEFKLLRFLIFPEIRVKNVRTLRSAEDSGVIKTLDLAQEKVAKSIPEGHRVLKGVAGSGKTLVLSCRAKYLSKLHTDWRILAVCYGITFAQYLRQLITGAADGNNSNIEVLHYHDLVKKLTGENLQKRGEESQEQWDSRIGTILLNAIGLGRITMKYDAILIDEGQDFTVEWLQSLTGLLNPETDSLLLCLDPAQNIFGRRIPYKSAGIKVQGKRPVLLKQSYRNTVEILELARTFSKVPSELSKAANHDDNFDDALFPMHTDRHGEQPRVVENIASDNQIEFVLDEVQHYITSGKCSWSDIAVLYASPPSGAFARFCTQFSRRFGTNRLYWVTENREAKLALDVNSEKVKLSTIESVKGMEFRIVFLLGLEQLPRSDRDQESERNLAYVGITRAQDVLYILGSAKTGYFQEIVVAVLGDSITDVDVVEDPPAKLPSSLLNRALASLARLPEKQSTPFSANQASMRTEALTNVAVENNLSAGGINHSPRLNRNRRQRRRVYLSRSGELVTTIDYVGLLSSPFGQIYLDIARRPPYCVEATQAEQIVDKIMTFLGLTAKTSLPHKFNTEREFTYEDDSRSIMIRVSIRARPKDQSAYRLSQASDREPLYWLFNCSAVRSDVHLFRPQRKERWRTAPALFAEDVWQLVNDLSSVQVEAEGRFLGELVAWNEKGAYGFLSVPGIGELFLHKTAVRRSDQRCLQIGQWFSFRLTESDRKAGSVMAIEAECRTNPQKSIAAKHS